MDYQTGFQDGYRVGVQMGQAMARQATMDPVMNQVPTSPPLQDPSPKKKRVSAYNRRYKAAFKKVAPRYKLKSGKWKAGGFKRAVKEAHRIAGGKKR